MRFPRIHICEHWRSLLRTDHFVIIYGIIIVHLSAAGAIIISEYNYARNDPMVRFDYNKFIHRRNYFSELWRSERLNYRLCVDSKKTI